MAAGGTSQWHAQSHRFVPTLEQFARSPHCGFASTEEGNVLTAAVARRLLATDLTLPGYVY
jgi:hypothetical protein